MKKSQSALEYMMTYGWAILIIVIVAAALYSMGVFSPASSTSATITGFSGLSATTATCFEGQGLAIEFTNNVGKQVNLTSINVTSSEGVVSINLSHTVGIGSGATLFVPMVCPSSQGRSFSDSVTITYTEPSSVFSGHYISTGRILGSSAAYSTQNAYGWAFGTYTGSGPSSQWGIDDDPIPGGSGVADYGQTTYGLVTKSNFPIPDLNQDNVNSTGACGTGESGPEGYTAIATMYITNSTINMSSWVDDAQDVWYKHVGSSSWTQAVSFGCCKLNTQSVSLTPGLYNIMVQWLNACGGGSSTMFITNAFMEYSSRWQVTSWDGGTLSASVSTPDDTPTGDTFDSTSQWSGLWP